MKRLGIKSLLGETLVLVVGKVHSLVSGKDYVLVSLPQKPEHIRLVNVADVSGPDIGRGHRMAQRTPKEAEMTSV